MQAQVQVRNLLILVLCQFISATGSIVMVTLGGIIGSTLSSNKALATLPVSMMVVAVAATTVPATMLMRRVGRRKGFGLASMASVIALLFAILALHRSSFVLFILATMLFGINMAFTQQYRYAAVENVPGRYTARAVSLVLIGSIGGAFLGPALATHGQFWVTDIPFAGSMVSLIALFLVQIILFTLMTPSTAQEDAVSSEQQRPLASIVRQPVFVVAVLGGTVGYGLMTLVMTATPLSMHINDGFSLEQTAGVIRIHVLAMYVPSLFTGFLIERIGVTPVMLIGAIGLFAVSVVGLQGHTVMHYWWALLLLGVGWNFLYIGGTTLLTFTYSAAERFRAQAVNEFSVFGVSATASLLAGSVMHFYGWSVLMLIPIPILLLICVALILIRNKTLLLQRNSADA